MYLYQWLSCQTNRWQKCVSYINEAYNNIWEELDSAVLYLKASFLLASLMFLSLYKINPQQMFVSNCKKKKKEKSRYYYKRQSKHKTKRCNQWEGT